MKTKILKIRVLVSILIVVASLYPFLPSEASTKLPTKQAEIFYAPTTITNNPTANSGSWTSPTNAYADGTSATTITSGSPSAAQIYNGYGFNLTGNVINSVRIRYDAWATAGAAIAWRANGTTGAATSGTVTPSLPTGTAVNDILICLIVSKDNISSTMDAKWTAVDAGTNNGTGLRTTVFWTRYDGTLTRTVTHTAGSYIRAVIMAFSGVIPTGSPFDVNQATYVKTPTSTTNNFGGGMTTTINNDKIVLLSGCNNNVSSATYTGSPTPAERLDDGATNYPRAIMAEFTQATAGATGARASTIATSLNNGYQLSLKPDTTMPQARVDVSSDGGVTWSTKQITGLSGVETTYWYDVTLLFAWTPTKLNDTNFRVRIDSLTVGTTRVTNLDWIPVEVIYSACDTAYIPPSVSSPMANYFEIGVSGDKIRFGDTSESSNFTPSITVGKWSDQSWFSLTPDSATMAVVGSLGTATLSSNTITAENSVIKFVYQSTEPAVGFNELGGLDFVITYKSKPSMNTLTYTYNNLSVNAYLQPSLTREWTIGQDLGNGVTVASVTDTDVMGSDGKNHFHRPDYVVNSIVFYGGTNQVNNAYKTGEIGVLYPMKANGQWCSWNVSGGTITLTIPQSVIDSAVYPLVVTPTGDTFGYTTKGSSHGTMGANNIVGALFTGAAGTATSISLYNYPDAGKHFNSAIYRDSDMGLVANGTSTVLGSTDQLYTMNLTTTPAISAVGYWLLRYTDDTGDWFYYNSGDANQSLQCTRTYDGNFDSTLGTHTHDSYKWSIYVNYTPQPAAPTNVVATDGTYTDKVTITWTKTTGATNYRVYRGAVNDSGTLGDVATYDDTASAAPTITPGTADASDGTSASYVTCTLSGQSASNGTTESYTVYAYNTGGWSVASSADNGYRGTTTLTFQWQRSDADSDANYNTNTGTTNPYNDTGAPSNGDKRYFRCVVSMTGATNQNSTGNEGYRLAYDISNSAGTAGITSFTITYVSDTQMDLAWTVDATVDKVMVRAKYGSYPADIPDAFTAPSDGYLVYYGVGLAASDTSMDFDQNSGLLYYKAWAQKLDGTWYTVTKSGAEESAKMTLIALVALAGLLSFMAIMSKNIILAIVAAGSWVGLGSYLAVNPPISLPAGSNGLNIILLVVFGAGVGILAYGVYQTVINNREKRAEVNYYARREDASPRSFRAYEESVGRNTRTGGDESLEDYRVRIRAKARPWEGRRR